MNLHQQLRAHTSEAHTKIESLPYHTALMVKKLDPLSIISFLRCMAIIHTTLEIEMNDRLDARVKLFYHPGLSKLQHINHDLQILSAEVKPIIAAALESTMRMARQIVKESHLKPFFLLGVLYVTEGSQNGGIFLKSIIAECLQLRPDQLHYFGAYGADTAKIWTSFTEKLNALHLTDMETQQVMEGAKFTFDSLGKVIESLHPLTTSELIHHASAINPEAGTHAIPQDPEEIKIAYLAGQKAWNQFPYLGERFHERGKRFTTSDSCWLLTLYHLEAPLIKKNVLWLRNLLSIRGIPSIILESHMGEILKQLQNKWPSKFMEYSAFESVILDLYTMRTAQVSQARWHELSSEYEKLLQQSGGHKIPGAANLLISAWADQASGVNDALAATQSWLTDAARFTEPWISTVNTLSKILMSAKS